MSAAWDCAGVGCTLGRFRPASLRFPLDENDKFADMRSLDPAAKVALRRQVIELRLAGRSYPQIAQQTGLSRTGIFDICKRHRTGGAGALTDAPGGRRVGEGRKLAPEQEALLRGLIIADAPDELGLPQRLWSRSAVAALIEQRTGLRMPLRTLASYLLRWGFAPTPSPARRPGACAALLGRWLSIDYPVVQSAARAQDAEIRWVVAHRLCGDAPAPVSATPGQVLECGPGSRRLPSMIASVTNLGQARWSIFRGALGAPVLIRFLGRSIEGQARKLFLILEGLHLRDDGPVDDWLTRHEDAVQVFHLPGEPDRERPRRRVKPALAG